MDLRLSSLIAMLALLCGCETAPGPAAEGDYVPPHAGATAQATLKGSRNSDGGFFGGEHTGFLLMIDSKMVRAGQETWNQPLGLAPGKHSIVAKYTYSNFVSQAFLSFEAKVGAAYRLEIKGGTEKPDDRRYCEFWIVDVATGQPVTEVQHRNVSGGKTAPVFSAR